MGTIVSAIMPTFNRREFIPLALKSYLSQDWKEKELIVIDDGTDPILDLLHDIPRLNYIAPPKKETIGAKRNIGCEAAKGKIIVHFDDDDWSATNRISSQVWYLVSTGKSVAGYSSMRYWDGAVASKFAGDATYSGGSALCYRREYWKENRFEETDFGEDHKFFTVAREKGQAITVDCGKMMVARTHAGNTCKRERGIEIPASELAAEFFGALAC